MEEEAIVAISNGETLVERFTLSNGLRLITEYIPWIESVSLGFFLLVGSAYESRRLNGISHFLEHMLFKGTQNRSSRDIVMQIESLGGVINAATGKEFTNFYSRIYHKHLPEAVDVLTDLILHPLFPEREMEREKLVITEEIKSAEDNPDEFIVDRFYLNVLGDTALGRKIAGTAHSVQSFTLDDLLAFHGAHYKPSNIVVSASGKVRGQMMCDLLERSFRKAGGFTNAKPRKRRLRAKPEFRPARFILRRDVEQTTVIIGYPSISLYDPDRYAFALMDAYLAGGMSSRLFQEVREKRGLVYSIDSTQALMSTCGVYTIEGGMAAKNAHKVARIVAKELRHIAEDGIPPRRLKNAREYIKGVMLLGLENPTTRMSRNGVGEIFHNRYIPMSELIEELDRVESDDAQALAARVFKPEKLAVGILTSDSTGEEGEGLLRAVTQELGVD